MPCRLSLRGPRNAGFLVGLKQETLAKFLFCLFWGFGNLWGQNVAAWCRQGCRTSSLGGPGPPGKCWLARVGTYLGLGSRMCRLTTFRDKTYRGASFSDSIANLARWRASAAWALALPPSNYPGLPMASAALDFWALASGATCLALGAGPWGDRGKSYPKWVSGGLQQPLGWSAAPRATGLQQLRRWVVIAAGAVGLQQHGRWLAAWRRGSGRWTLEHSSLQTSARFQLCWSPALVAPWASAA